MVIIIVLVFQGCYNDKEEVLYPGSNTCDTTNVTYSLTVAPIISNYCLACHGSSVYNTLGGNLDLDGYDHVIIVVNNGALLKSIDHLAGASPMPKNSPKLSDCNILKIKKWISNSAPNN